jgi:hypothetical protein
MSEGGSSMELPTRMQFRFREINKMLKQTVTLTPNNGQADVNANDTIIVELPHNSVIDLTTFIMDYTGSTTHGGKTNTGAGATGAGYLQTRFFPRNSASIIEQLDVEVNGQTRFTLNNYGFVYNTLFDLTAAQDSLNCRKVGENADPSSKFINVNGVITERRGFSTGLIANGSAYDKENYVIRSWLGLLNPSTTIIDTNILGSVVIKIRLAPANCLILGSASDAAIAAVPANDAANETGVAIDPVAAGGQLGANTENYTLSNVKFTVVRWELPSEFYMTEASRLASGAVFKLWFPNYTVQSCPSVAAGNKSGVNRTSISTRSLDWVMGTFRLPNYTNIEAPLNAMGTAPSALGPVGQTKYTWESQVRAGLRRLFNNSRYYARNGSSVKSTIWKIGHAEHPKRTVQQSFDALLQHFNIQNDQGSGGMYPGIQSLHHFVETFYSDIISLNVPGETDPYCISGLNTQEPPLQITWTVEADAIPQARNAANTADVPTIPGLIDLVATQCTPYLICGYTSCLEIRGGRQITLIN